MNIDTITADLAALATTAPDETLHTVLSEVGLVPDEFTLVEGPTGPAYVSWSDAGVTAFVPKSIVGTPEEFAEQHPRPTIYVEAPPARLARHLDRALETGKLGKLPVDLSALGDFQRKVLEKCAEIPPGEIRPYGWIAREIGSPGAVRAVGTALGRNPIPMLIPCHRVVRTDGTIGNYAWGSEMKRALLVGEGLDPDGIEATARRGTRVVGTGTTHIYCYPTCRHAKRSSDQYRVEFRSPNQAEDAGYRACKVCRPAA
jgi:O-6-methylguanine DNA methyltransferase